MSATLMDPTLADAVRGELASIGTKNSLLQRHQRRSRALALTIGVVAVAGVTMGAAVVVNNLPGTTTIAPLGSIVTATHTGTATIDLGAAPAHADAVILDLTCLSPQGTVTVPTDNSINSSGDSVTTECSMVESPTHIDDGLLPKAGTTTMTITADPGTSWKIVAQYASSATSAWGVNPNGQTYGVPNGKGMPDLQSAQATNGKVGYISTKQILSFPGKGYLNVYESDGTTVIGQFPIGQ